MVGGLSRTDAELSLLDPLLARDLLQLVPKQFVGFFDLLDVFLQNDTSTVNAEPPSLSPSL